MSERALIDLRPWHVALGGAGLAVLAVAVDPPAVLWLIVLAGCLGGAWWARTADVGWPSAVHVVLVECRLASARPGAAVASATGPAAPVIPQRPLTFGEILSAAVTIVRRHWQISCVFSVLALVVAMTVLVVAYLVFGTLLAPMVFAGGPDSLGGLLLLLVVFVVVFLALLTLVGVPTDAAINCVSVLTAEAALRGEPVRVERVFARGRARVLAMCRLTVVFYGVSFLTAWILPAVVMLTAGFEGGLVASVVLVPVSFAVNVLFSLAPVIIAVEDVGAAAALRRSAALVRPAWARLIGLHLLWVVMAVAAFATVGCPLGVVVAVIPGGALLFYPGVLVVLAVAFPFFRTLQTVLYADLRIRAGSFGGAGATSAAGESSGETVVFEASGSMGEPFGPDSSDRGSAASGRVPKSVGAQSKSRAESEPKGVPASGASVAEPEARGSSGSDGAGGRSMGAVSLRKAGGDDHAAPDPGPDGRRSIGAVGSAAAGVSPKLVGVQSGTLVSLVKSSGTSERSKPVRTLAEDDPDRTASATVLPGTSGGTPAATPGRTSAPSGASELSGPSAPTRTSRRPGLAAVIAVVTVVLALVTTGLLVRQHSGSGVADLPIVADHQLRNTFPTAPAPSWRVRAADVIEAAYPAFSGPSAAPYQVGPANLIDLGDTLIVRAVAMRTDAEPRLVALDARSGKTRWTSDGWYRTCADATVDGLLPCYRSGGIGDPTRARSSQVVFLGVTDGSVDHALDVDDISWLAVFGDHVITASYERVTSGTSSDLTADWNVEWTPRPACPGSGDSYQHGVNENFVYFGSDGGAIVLRRADGKRVFDADVRSVAFYPGRGVVAETCAQRDPDAITTVIADINGDHTRSHTGVRDAARVRVGPNTEGPYLAAGAAWDFTDGSKLWSVDGEMVDAAVIDDVAVIDDGETISGLDLNTGARRWSSDVDGGIALTDRQRVLVTDTDRSLEALDLRTGTTAWSIPFDSGSPERAGEGFAVIDSDVLTYYGPTGGPASRPAESADPAADTGPRLVTRCGRAPKLTPVEYRTDTAGLVVRMELRANCPGGDIVSTDGLRVEISEGGRPIAAGVFDLSATPITLPPPDASGSGSGSGSGTVVRHDFEFPVGSFWRLPNSLAANGNPSTVRVPGSSTQLVTCVDQGVKHGPQQAELTAHTPRRIPLAAPAPTTGDPQAAAWDALRAQADADRPTVQRDLADRWLPQLSSKQPGLVAPDENGHVITWTPTDILAHHLRLRLRYPEVRLVWSDEWRTFDLQGWWVTLAGTTFPTPTEANTWCDTKSIPRDECFAKLVSNTRTSTGTTQYR